jgi:hypothetical protein
LHKLASSFVLGYHGCDRAVAERLLAGASFKASTNDWDWLGHGTYFWETNPARGLEFANQLKLWRHDQDLAPINDPYVVGAVIELGYCLDLMTSTGVQTVASAHRDFAAYCKRGNIQPPINSGGRDSLFRRLDCAVINHLHSVRESAVLQPFDSVRGVFIEGEPLYPGSGFYQKTHIQICVRNTSLIKGVFRVPDNQLAG